MTLYQELEKIHQKPFEMWALQKTMPQYRAIMILPIKDSNTVNTIFLQNRMDKVLVGQNKPTSSGPNQLLEFITFSSMTLTELL